MPVLERDADLRLVEELLGAACEGRGSVLLVMGPAGIGKSTLIAAACEPAGGLQRLSARGGELEHDLALGVWLQLFEPAIGGAASGVRRRRLDGTGPAGAVLAGRIGGAPDPPVLLAGMHRLVVNLAAEGPLLLEVDDVHWADGPSLRFLAHLAHRIAELPVALLLGHRSGERSVDEPALRSIAAEPEARELMLAPLSEEATGRLVRSRAGDAADDVFCGACHAACGGNPFLLGELVKEMLRAGVLPDAGGAERVRQAGPPAVARWAMARIDRLPDAAGALARAVAVLGHDAELHRAVRLAELTLDAAEEALDSLVAIELLVAGRPLAFTHPVLRAAVHDALPPGQRSREHRRAAALLREDGAAPGAVAAHLLATEPGGEPWVAEALLDGARAALAQGAPEIAIGHLERALEEPPAPRLRPSILRSLGQAERRRNLATADARFLAALDELTDPVERGETVLEMVLAAPVVRVDVVALIRRAMADVDGIEPSLALMLRAQLLLQIENRLGESEQERRDAEQALSAHPEDTLGTRMLAAMLARQGALLGRPRPEVLEHALRALGDDDRYAESLDADQPLMYAIAALSCSDELALADRRATQAIERADRRGSLVGAAIPLFLRAHIRVRSGALPAAEEDGRRALKLATTGGAELLTAVAAGALVRALSERGEIEQAETALAALGYTDDIPSTNAFADVRLARSLLRLTAGRYAEAYEDAIAVGREAEPLGLRSPVLCPWRSLAALALLALGRREEALRHARAELAIAETADIPSAIGVAQRVTGLATGGDAGLELLRAAVARLETAPAPIEYARALLDFGGALRRKGNRQAARGPLAEALELAHRHGAAPIAATAHQELLATGARPRRAFRTGVEALTVSERRVAEAAASGLRNREIAQRLFVSPKTVEHHLAAVYQKLNVSSRRDLPERLNGR